MEAAPVQTVRWTCVHEHWLAALYMQTPARCFLVLVRGRVRLNGLVVEAGVESQTYASRRLGRLVLSSHGWALDTFLGPADMITHKEQVIARAQQTQQE